MHFSPATDGRSSTGQVAIHSVLLPYSYKVLLFGRNLPKSGPKSTPEPGVGGNVSTVYDVTSGTYVVTPNYETLFCAGHTVREGPKMQCSAVLVTL